MTIRTVLAEDQGIVLGAFASLLVAWLYVWLRYFVIGF